jgi:hypothetical protein
MTPAIPGVIIEGGGPADPHDPRTAREGRGVLAEVGPPLPSIKARRYNQRNFHPKEQAMGKINWNRVILGGLVAGVIINIFEFALHGAVLAKDMDAAVRALGREVGGKELLMFLAWGFLVGIFAVWLYREVALKWREPAGFCTPATSGTPRRERCQTLQEGPCCLPGSGNSANTPANQAAEGSRDWVHWGDGSVNRKAGVTAQLNASAAQASGGELQRH